MNCVQTVHVDGQGGRIWTKPPCVQTNGLLSVIRSAASHRAVIALARFNGRGDKFTIGDSRGNIYHFHVLQNRYSLIYRAGVCPTAMAASTSPSSIIAVAFDDNIIRVFDADSSLLIASLRAHRFQISFLSFHPSGNTLTSTSKDRVVVWETQDWRRKRTLETSASPLLHATFSPSGEVIFTSVANEGIIAWNASTFKMLYQLGKSSSSNVSCFAVIDNSRYLLAGIRSSPLLHLWELKTTALLRVIVLPESAKYASKVQFLSNTDAAIVLMDDGSILMFNILNLRVLLTLRERTKEIRDFDLAPGGRYCTCIMDDGSISLYDLKQGLETESIRQKSKLKDNSITSTAYEILKAVPANVNDELSISQDSQPKERFIKHDNILANDGYDSERDKDDSFSRQIESPVSRVILDPLKLKSLLKAHGEYPAEYRAIIWRTILKLPENYDQFNAYLSRGLHPALKDFHNQYPLQDRRLLRRIGRILSALFYWCPLLSEVDYLPAIVFPFLRMYSSDNNVVFELVVTLLLNWGRHWLEFFPNPPVLILKEVERLLEHHAPELFSHFHRCEIHSGSYAWPLLKSLFTDAFPKSEWLILFDHILSNKPTFMFFVLVAYLFHVRKPLLSMNSRSHIENFVASSNVIGSPVARLIQDGYRLRKSTPVNLLPKDESWISLQNGFYPAFDNLPRFIEDFQLHEHQRIKREFEAQEEISNNLEFSQDPQGRNALSANVQQSHNAIPFQSEYDEKREENVQQSVPAIQIGAGKSSALCSIGQRAHDKFDDEKNHQARSIGGLRAEFRDLLEKRNETAIPVPQQSPRSPEDILLQHDDEDLILNEKANRILKHHQERDTKSDDADLELL